MPGPDEEDAGYPFAGRSGAQWREGLESLGLKRQDFAILNEQFCRWPGAASGARKRQDGKVRQLRKKAEDRIYKQLRGKGIKPKPARASAKRQAKEEVLSPQECCRPAFEKELFRYPYVIALGATAAAAAANMTGGIHAVRGDMIEVARSPAALQHAGRDPSRWPCFGEDGQLVQRVVPTFHPAYVARAPGARHRWLSDLAKALRWFNDALTWRVPSAIYQPTPEMLEAFTRGKWPRVGPESAACDEGNNDSRGKPEAGPEFDHALLPPVEEWEQCPFPIPFFVFDYETDGVHHPVGTRCIGLATPDLKPNGRPAMPGDPVAWPARAIGIHFVKCRGGTGGLREDHDAVPGRYYNAGNDAALRAILRRIHLQEHPALVGHNAIVFDGQVSLAFLGVLPKNCIDTLGHARAVNPEVPKGLKAIATQYTDIDHWETTEKGEKAATSEKVTDFERLDYCARGDCVANARAGVVLYSHAAKRGYSDELRQDLKPAGWGSRPWTLEESDREFAYTCRELGMNGQYVDREEVGKLTRKYEGKTRDLRSELVEIAEHLGFSGIDLDSDEQETGDGTAINPGAYGQVRELLYERCKLWCPPGMKEDKEFLTDTGLPGTGDAVLRAHLADPKVVANKPLAAFIWKLRLLRRYENKYLGTILRRAVPRHEHPKSKGYIGPDQRIHASWGWAMAAPGRGNSRDPNLQNQISLLKVIYCAQPDPWGRTRYIIQCDLDQAHLRIIANAWMIQALRDGFLNGKEAHGQLANIMYAGKYITADGWGERGAPPSHDQILAGWKPVGGAADGYRQKAKTFRYARCYKASPDTVLRVMQSTEVGLYDAEGNEVLDRHGIQKTSLPNLGMTLHKHILPMCHRHDQAESDWGPAWDRVIAKYAAQGYVESLLFGRKSGALSGGKEQEVVNFEVLSTEPDIMRLCEFAVKQRFPFQAHGPGTGMISQVHDSIAVEWVGGRMAPLTKADKYQLATKRSLGDGFVAYNKRYKWDAEVEDNRRALEDAMTVRIPGWDIPFTAEADVGMNLKEA